MATYVITRSRSSDPDNEHERLERPGGFKCRQTSRDGHECAEEAFARLTKYPDRAMWRYEYDKAAVLVKCAADGEK